MQTASLWRFKTMWDVSHVPNCSKTRVRLAKDSYRGSRSDECNKIIPVGCGTFYCRFYFRRKKKKMELRNQSMLSIFLEKRKKRNSQVLYETTLYTSYEFSIFFFFFLNKQVKIMLLFLSTIIYTIKILFGKYYE